MRRLAVLMLLAVLASAGAAVAHEVRPAYLELRQGDGEVWQVLWKVPARGTARLALTVELPSACVLAGPVEGGPEGAAFRQSWSVRCAGGLAGGTIAIQGLAGTITDVLVRLVPASGSAVEARLTPAAPSFVVPAEASSWDLVATYTLLGVEHILLGIDHLLFVLALLLLVRGGWRIVQTLTAFTLAHSVTLAAAVLGYVEVPIAPVEAVIALSILFLALEICRLAAGQVPLSARRPWLVAFAFGLLHGFGFAGALSETGLPPDAIPLALLTFNLGVELGQVAFVAAALPLLGLLSRLLRQRRRWGLVAGAYAIGSLAAAWLIERLVGLA